MVNFYVFLISKGSYTLDQVPPKWYEEVKAIVEPEPIVVESSVEVE